MNRIFKQLAAVLLALVLLAGTALAALPDRLIPGGQAIGLQLQTDGVSIVELAQDNPCAREAGLRRGDVIRAIDGERVSTVRQVTAAVSASGGQALTIRYERGGKAAETAVQPQRTADGWRLGVFVRDSITGIGTVTYYDPENGTFGALGHGVCDSSALLPLRSGLALPAAVTSVTRGEVGTPGALHGAVTGRSRAGQSAATRSAAFSAPWRRRRTFLRCPRPPPHRSTPAARRSSRTFPARRRANMPCRSSPSSRMSRRGAISGWPSQTTPCWRRPAVSCRA